MFDVSPVAKKLERYHRRNRHSELWYCRSDEEDTFASNKEDIEEAEVG